MTTPTLESLANAHGNKPVLRDDVWYFTIDQLSALVTDLLEQNKDGRPQLERVIIDEIIGGLK